MCSPLPPLPHIADEETEATRGGASHEAGRGDGGTLKLTCLVSSPSHSLSFEARFLLLQSAGGSTMGSKLGKAPIREDPREMIAVTIRSPCGFSGCACEQGFRHTRQGFALCPCLFSPTASSPMPRTRLSRSPSVTLCGESRGTQKTRGPRPLLLPSLALERNPSPRLSGTIELFLRLQLRAPQRPGLIKDVIKLGAIHYLKAGIL